MTPPARRQPGRAVGVPDYLWDARLGNYVNRATGRMVKRTTIQEALGAVCDRGAATLAGIAEAGQNGTLTPRQFYEAMQREVRQLYNASAALGKGGWAQMTPADWGRVGRALRDEYGRLRDFAQGLADGTISEKQAIARARLYADSAYRQYWRSWGGLQAGLGNDEERWESSKDEKVCVVCRELEARGWQPIGTLPEPGEPHAGDRCQKSWRRAADTRAQPARPPAPDRAAILPPQLAALARARLTQTALTSLALTAELRTPALHYGPGPHPDGSPQSVHAGGATAPEPSAPPQTAAAAVARAAAHIRHAPQEHFYAFDTTGRQIRSVAGDAESVDPGSRAELRDAITLHNHPVNAARYDYAPAFSKGDVAAALEHGVAEMHVVSARHDHVMRFAPAIRTDARFRNRVLARETELRVDTFDALDGRGWTPTRIRAELPHLVWTALARELPELTYARTPAPPEAPHA